MRDEYVRHEGCDCTPYGEEMYRLTEEAYQNSINLQRLDGEELRALYIEQGLIKTNKEEDSENK